MSKLEILICRWTLKNIVFGEVDLINSMEIGKVNKNGVSGRGGGNISPKYVSIGNIYLFLLHFSRHSLTKIVFKCFTNGCKDRKS